MQEKTAARAPCRDQTSSPAPPCFFTPASVSASAYAAHGPVSRKKKRARELGKIPEQIFAPRKGFLTLRSDFVFVHFTLRECSADPAVLPAGCVALPGRCHTFVRRKAIVSCPPRW